MSHRCGAIIILLMLMAVIYKSGEPLHRRSSLSGSKTDSCRYCSLKTVNACCDCEGRLPRLCSDAGCTLPATPDKRDGPPGRAGGAGSVSQVRNRAGWWAGRGRPPGLPSILKGSWGIPEIGQAEAGCRVGGARAVACHSDAARVHMQRSRHAPPFCMERSQHRGRRGSLESLLTQTQLPRL